MKERNKTISRMQKDPTVSRLETYTKQLETIRDQIHGKWIETSTKLSAVAGRHDVLTSGLQKILEQDRSSQDIASKRLNHIKDSIKKLVTSDEDKVCEKLKIFKHAGTQVEAGDSFTEKDQSDVIVDINDVNVDSNDKKESVVNARDVSSELESIEEVCIKEELMDFEPGQL